MISIYLFLFIFFFSTSCESTVIRFCSFNIQIFGQTKLSKTEVVESLIEIISNFDIILVQEIRDAEEIVAANFLELLNATLDSDEQYDFVMSERLGRSNSKENYAFFYKPKLVNPVETYQYFDKNDYFERPPYAAQFEVLDCGQQFFVMGLHAKPDDAFQEIKHMIQDVYEDYFLDNSSFTESEKEVFRNYTILAGDLNADCDYLSNVEVEKLKSYSADTLDWIITEDSTISQGLCAYDRFIVSKHRNYMKTLNPKVYNYTEKLGIDLDFSLEISDHYPIYVDLEFIWGDENYCTKQLFSSFLLICIFIFVI